MIKSSKLNGKALLINPPSLFDPQDPFTTGIVYLPIGLAYLAGSLRAADIDFRVLDAFGKNPNNAQKIGNFIRLGLDDEIILQEISDYSPNVILFYANQILNHDGIVQLIRKLRERGDVTLVGVLENSQAVTAYKLNSVADSFFSVGADFLVSGEIENRVLELLEFLFKNSFQIELNKIDGVSLPGRIRESSSSRLNLSDLPIPLWEEFPVESYWALGYAHGPKTELRYLPILTSRGCPFSCEFCVVPAVSQRRWAGRSPESVFNEMCQLNAKFQVNEFHIEDLNPTIDENRIIALANLLIGSGHNFIWKIVAGTKIETIKHLDSFPLLSKSGLRFISMSPESGSLKVQKLIGKSFNKPYGIKVVKVCRNNEIATQACFILGFPGETLIDIFYSLLYLCHLTWCGLDEVALFIVSPIPGSQLFNKIGNFGGSLSELNFSPKWRKDYRKLQFFRIFMYGCFILLKFLRHPSEIFRFLKNTSSRSFRTKMEMTFYRGRMLRKLSKSVTP